MAEQETLRVLSYSLLGISIVSLSMEEAYCFARRPYGDSILYYYMILRNAGLLTRMLIVLLLSIMDLPTYAVVIH